MVDEDVGIVRECNKSLNWSQSLRDDSDIEGTIIDRGWTPVALPMLLEAASTLIQERSFVDIFAYLLMADGCVT